MINLIIVDEEYYKENNEKLTIDYYGTGGARYIEYINKHNPGFIGKKNGPAGIRYYITGRIDLVKWVNHNAETHRLDGPALIQYNHDGVIEQIKWYYKGQIYTIEVFNWLKENNFDKWQDMCKSDYNRMWMEIL